MFHDCLSRMGIPNGVDIDLSGADRIFKGVDRTLEVDWRSMNASDTHYILTESFR